MMARVRHEVLFIIRSAIPFVSTYLGVQKGDDMVGDGLAATI